jgi:hypothetical protein
VSDRSFSSFLSRSLELLEREAPAASARVAASLGARSVLVRVDGESLGLACKQRKLAVGPVPLHPSVSAQTTRDVLLALLQGEFTLTDAVMTSRVALRGPIDDLVALYAGLQAYFHGAVRSPGFPGLLDAFRSNRPPKPG